MCVYFFTRLLPSSQPRAGSVCPFPPLLFLADVNHHRHGKHTHWKHTSRRQQLSSASYLYRFGQYTHTERARDCRRFVFSTPCVYWVLFSGLALHKRTQTPARRKLWRHWFGGWPRKQHAHAHTLSRLHTHTHTHSTHQNANTHTHTTRGNSYSMVFGRGGMRVFRRFQRAHTHTHAKPLNAKHETTEPSSSSSASARRHHTLRRGLSECVYLSLKR